MTQIRTEKKGETPTDSNRDEFLREARERFIRANDAERNNRERAMDDVRFRNGDQWPDDIKQKRTEQKRPTLTFNRMEAFIDQVVGDQRQTRPSIKVVAVDADDGSQRVVNVNGTKDYTLADVYNGMIRHIEYDSRAHRAYDTAYDHAVGHGWGYFRVLTAYDGDLGFDQKLVIKRIKNPFSVYMDPKATEIDMSDAGYAFVSTFMPKKDFDTLYPNNAGADTGEMLGEESELWYESDKIRVTEYYRKVPQTKSILQLSDGRVVDESAVKPVLDELASQGITVVNRRSVRCHKIEWYKITGTAILEGPTPVPGKYIPIIRVTGKELNVGGEDVLRGLIRHGKDAQRMYNYGRTTLAETLALAPKAPFTGDPRLIEGYEHLWKTANTENHSFLPQKTLPGVMPIQRMQPAMPNSAALQESLMSSDDMKSIIGLHNASLGAVGNETSGKAILARQREGDVGTYAFIDNLASAIAQCGRVLVDLIPLIYDSERVVRIRGVDGAEDWVRVNQMIVDTQTGVAHKVHDLSSARFDVEATVGPTYTTQRVEAAAGMLDIATNNPQIWGIAGDLIAANLDWPNADELAARLRKTIPPNILPPDPDQEPAPAPPPSPQEQAVIAKSTAEIAKAEAIQTKAQADTLRMLKDANDAVYGSAANTYGGANGNGKGIRAMVRDEVARGFAELIKAMG
jgi:hypothetical protein